MDTRWIRRIRQGRPIIKLGAGHAIHRLLHVDDARSAFVHMLHRQACLGQTYHPVNPRHVTWASVHDTAMRVLGREVEQVGVSAEVLHELDPERFAMAKGIFAQNLLFTAAKLQRDVPEFNPQVSLEDGLADAVDYLDAHPLVEGVPKGDWEDQIIAAQTRLRHLDLRVRG